MEIEVRLFATLRLNRGKKLFMPCSEETTPRHLMDSLKIPIEDVAILLINGRDGEFDKKLSDHDVVSIFPPVGGG